MNKKIEKQQPELLRKDAVDYLVKHFSGATSPQAWISYDPPKPAPIRTGPKREWLGFWPELFSRVVSSIIVLMLFMVLFAVGFGLAELLGWLP